MRGSFAFLFLILTFTKDFIQGRDISEEWKRRKCIMENQRNTLMDAIKNCLDLPSHVQFCFSRNHSKDLPTIATLSLNCIPDIPEWFKVCFEKVIILMDASRKAKQSLERFLHSLTLAQEEELDQNYDRIAKAFEEDEDSPAKFAKEFRIPKEYFQARYEYSRLNDKVVDGYEECQLVRVGFQDSSEKSAIQTFFTIINYYNFG